jgi:hypothetical protein
MAAAVEFTSQEVAAHKTADDVWMTINGKGTLNIPERKKKSSTYFF